MPAIYQQKKTTALFKKTCHDSVLFNSFPFFSETRIREKKGSLKMQEASNINKTGFRRQVVPEIRQFVAPVSAIKKAVHWEGGQRHAGLPRLTKTPGLSE